MTDEPQDNESSETPEEAPVEGSGDQAAGPAAGGSPPAHPPEGQPPTPAAADTSESSGEEPSEDVQDEVPAEESDESPTAEREETKASESPPGKKDKDVIPGADLEPIAVEPEERPLSAEEQARREAEEEEQRAREAALTADTVEEERAASRAPAKIEGGSRYLATGKRKHAIARVTLLSGKGDFVVNGRPIEEFFPRPLHQTTARQPLAITGYEGSVDVRVRVHGGGVSGQAGAVRHGIARALTEVDPELRSELKRRGFLTRDARAKERRKAGLKKARKRPQFSKR